ncbi:MAG TPA: tryptophanase, partial [Petrimonas sp.]|nr:tryptophanase [Petrimonas sp.]
MELPFAESYRIKAVEAIKRSTRIEREQWIKEANYNLFALKSDYVFIDLLTDSGTGAMSDRQWSAMMLGDESYAGARSYYNLKDTVKEILGFNYFLPAHQGRAAENILFSAIIRKGNILPGNSHFDTTKGHIEFRQAVALDCTIEEANHTQLEVPFKGNVDVVKLEKVLKHYPREKIPAVVLTVTNNTAGGQPVSMENIKAVAA